MSIDLKCPSADLFDQQAELFAKSLCTKNERGYLPDTDKPSQLRRFYDQLVQLDERIKQVPADFETLLPEIRLLNAHIAYAHGRKLVSDTFRRQMQHIIRSIEGTPDTLHTARLFFEATLGFLRAERND